MTICEVCKQRPSAKSSVIREQYYSALCLQCYEQLVSGQTVSSGHADWERGRDFEDHESDIIQPTNRDGSISTEFTRLYPDTAKKIFSQDEINKAMRA